MLMSSKAHALLLAPALLALALAARGPLAAQEAFSFETLQARAAALAESPHKEHASRVPESLRRLTYDQYRQIAYKTDRALWANERGVPFRVQFFHPGFIQLHTVRVHEVVSGTAREVPFSSEAFDYRDAAGAAGSDFPADMGFSGLRVHNQLNRRGVWDDLIVFQGASYFRALAKGSHYGLSARGLAINTAEPGGEQFPVFEEFWIERPPEGSKVLRVWALLDSRGVTGAYQFIIAPDSSTVIDVNAVIYRRSTVTRVPQVFGIAPLTSMFWFGKSSAQRPADLRGEVHDSDGLLLHTGAGEWLWRPLDNPASVSVSVFSDENPRGFGLIQRERNFEHYQDIEAAYHLRPSVWIEPLGNWGRGAVRLVQLPTPDETNDNIVAFWAPDALPLAGEPFKINYRMHWYLTPAAETPEPPAGIVVATRQGRSFTHETDLQRFWVDFAGESLAKLPSDSEIDAVVSAGDGATLAHTSVEKNPHNNTWRAAFAIKPDGSGRPVELRCFLRKDKREALTETWSFLWTPAAQ